jgi:hypothetical protein
MRLFLRLNDHAGALHPLARACFAGRAAGYDQCERSGEAPWPSRLPLILTLSLSRYSAIREGCYAHWRSQVRSAGRSGGTNCCTRKHKHRQRSSPQSNVVHAPTPLRRLPRLASPVSLNYLRIGSCGKSIRMFSQFHIFIISYFTSPPPFASQFVNWR